MSFLEASEGQLLPTWHQRESQNHTKREDTHRSQGESLSDSFEQHSLLQLKPFLVGEPQELSHNNEGIAQEQEIQPDLHDDEL